MEIRRRDLFILFFILLVGIFPRLFHLGTIFFNEDEPFHQVRISYQPLSFVLAHNNGPLFSILVHCLLPVGALEIMARLVSAVSGILTILMTYVLGLTLFSKKEGWMGALFVSCSHLLIFYSQHSRAYSLLTLLSLLSLYYFYRAVREDRILFWEFYGVFTCLNLYNHLVAFFILPSFAVYVGIVWLDCRLKTREGLSGSSGSRIVKRFVVWTALAVLFALLMYLPSLWIRDFFLGTLRGGLAVPSDTVAVSLSRVNDIVRFQMSAGNSLVYATTLVLVVIGLAAHFKKCRREAALCFLYIILPWVIFLAGGARQNTLHSLYRYLIFLLPPMFLVAARGMTAVISFLDRFVFSARGGRSPILANVTLSVLFAVIAAGYVLSVRWYYIDYWNQGSFRLDREVREFLRDHAHRDAMLYVDAFPASSVTLMLSPMAKDLLPEDIETVVREEYESPPGSHQVMMYRLGWSYFEAGVASRKIELWAVTPRDPNIVRLPRLAISKADNVEIFDLKKNTVLHFKKNEDSLAQHMTVLADVLIALPSQNPVLLRQRHLFAAKAFFMTREVIDGCRELEAFEKILADVPDNPKESRGSVNSFLGGIWGLDLRKLRTIYEQRSLLEIQHLVYVYGNNLLAADRYDDAVRAYVQVLKLGKDYDSRVLDKFARLAGLYEKAGDFSKSMEIRNRMKYIRGNED